MLKYDENAEKSFQDYRWDSLLKGLTFLLILLIFSWNASVFSSDNDVVLKKGNVSLDVTSGGGLVIKMDGDIYSIESSFSFPGTTIGYNRFLNEKDRKPAFPVKVRKIGEDAFEIQLNCEYYYIIRTVRLRGEKIEICETIRNMVKSPVGVMIEHKVIGARKFESSLFSGYSDFARSSTSASNPTVYLKGKESGLGIVVKDSIFRLKLYSNLINPEAAGFGVRNFALDVKKEHRFEWDIYPMSGNNDYFRLINSIRRDWGANFTILGPYDFWDVIKNREFVKNEEQLKAYLERKKVKILALTPWLDYDNFNHATGSVMTRDEYKRVMQEARTAIKRVDPSIYVIGCMQSNLISLPPSEVDSFYKILPEKRRAQGIYYTTKAEKALLERSKVMCKDSIVHCADGSNLFELYYPMEDQESGKFSKNLSPMVAIAEYAAPWNCLFRYWMNQARFIIEEVGLDGIYIDQFSLAPNGRQRYSYDRWDGVTVDIDPASGRIARKYTDGAFVGIGARQALIEYVLSKAKVMVTNTHVTVKEIQSAPVFRFSEGYSDVNPLSLGKGQEPQFLGAYSGGGLSSPILLGFRPWRLGQEGKDNYVKVIMKTIITYLRNGMLFYCFNTEIPEEGIGNGDYGPINHMFPITPVRLGKGFIEGKERIITAVSGAFLWRGVEKPSILVFDIEGRQKKSNYEVVKTESGWRVSITLSDWEEIAVVE